MELQLKQGEVILCEVQFHQFCLFRLSLNIQSDSVSANKVLLELNIL